MGDKLFFTYRQNGSKAFGPFRRAARSLVGVVAVLAVGCLETGADSDPPGAAADTVAGDASMAVDATPRLEDAVHPRPDVAVAIDASTRVDASPVVSPDASPVVSTDASPVVAPDASAVVAPDASAVVAPDASAVIFPDASPVVFPDAASVVFADASAVVVPDAAPVVFPDAAPVVFPDAAIVVEPDGAVPVDPNAPLPDLTILGDRTAADLYFEEREFSPESCALIEGCVGGPGLRRLLRFDVSAANVGNVDLVMGDPADNPDLFQFSACHGHFHFNEYATYALRDPQGRVAAPGHKQAFCLLDSGRYLEGDPTVRPDPRFHCGFQGISRGWYDSYRAGLDCQWVDVTDVPPGDYDLEVRINPARVLPELDYRNNDLRLRVTVPSFRMDAPCGPNDDAGPDRMCGWQVGFAGQCSPGDLIDAGCLQAGDDCARAVCPEQPFMRACDGLARSCLPGAALAVSQNDCGTCPQTTFRCPQSGAYTVWIAPPDPGIEVVCDVGVELRPEPPVDTPCAPGGEVDGLARACGWHRATPAPLGCHPGERYLAGCTGGGLGCGIGAACVGDPMLVVCPGPGPCALPAALAASDDSCGGTCPSATFTCPDTGAVSPYAAPYHAADAATCDLGLVELH